MLNCGPSACRKAALQSGLVDRYGIFVVLYPMQMLGGLTGLVDLGGCSMPHCLHRPRGQIGWHINQADLEAYGPSKAGRCTFAFDSFESHVFWSGFFFCGLDLGTWLTKGAQNTWRFLFQLHKTGMLSGFSCEGDRHANRTTRFSCL